MGNFKTLLFDLDDTLIVEWESAKNTFVETISSVNVDINKDAFVKIIREEARLLWYKLPTIDYSLKVGISSWEALWADFDGDDNNLKLLKEYSTNYRLNAWKNALSRIGVFDINVAHELSEKFKEQRNKQHILFSDTLPCLNRLKGKYRLGLITNGAPDIQWKKINGGKLKHYFYGITISGEYGTGKPDPVLFEIALDKLDAKANETIVIGDSIGTDIKGANRTGIKSIWLNRENRINDEQNIRPDFEIKHLNELEDYI